MAFSLTLEASELLELFQWTKDNQINAGKEEVLRDELADCMYWLIKLSDYYKIDLLEAMNQKMDKNEAKYPINKAKDSASKYSDL